MAWRNARAAAVESDDMAQAITALFAVRQYVVDSLADDTADYDAVLEDVRVMLDDVLRMAGSPVER
jgi:hypothetical protein